VHIYTPYSLQILIYSEVLILHAFFMPYSLQVLFLISHFKNLLHDNQTVGNMQSFADYALTQTVYAVFLSSGLL